ncbi:MAG: 1-acyl-sn-glycerol-3-phosphate acyltransferase [bacterium]
MNARQRQRALKIVRRWAPDDYDRWVSMRVDASVYGYDPFGLERETTMLAVAVFQLLHKHWFRVESWGLNNVPVEGPVLLVPNHSGAIPIDAAMIAVDLMKKLAIPRVARAVFDNFAGCLPFVSLFFQRCGQFIGARDNLIRLLQKGEMVTVFPEGHRGTGKKFRDRYKLQPFQVGFVEASLITRTPIVPVAVIGAEEQYPFLLNLKPIAKVLKFPYLPLPLTSLLLGPVGLLPLPTKYQIHYGEPIRLYLNHSLEVLKSADIIRGMAEEVRSRVQDLVQTGLRRRKGVFGLSRPVLRGIPESLCRRTGGLANRLRSFSGKQVRSPGEASPARAIGHAVAAVLRSERTDSFTHEVYPEESDSGGNGKAHMPEGVLPPETPL